MLSTDVIARHETVRADRSKDRETVQDVGCEVTNHATQLCNYVTHQPCSCSEPVSYTHLDVYKRQVFAFLKKKGPDLCLFTRHHSA